MDGQKKHRKCLPLSLAQVKILQWALFFISKGMYMLDLGMITHYSQPSDSMMTPGEQANRDDSDPACFQPYYS